MGFTSFTSNRMEVLASQLASTLSEKKLSIFDKSTVIVQSRGMERWLKLQIAQQNSICANLDCPFPKHFINDIFSKTVGVEQKDLFAPEVMTWRIFKQLGSFKSDDKFIDINNYLAEDNLDLKRFQLSERLAIIFDLYQTFRPSMMLDWGGFQSDNIFFDSSFKFNTNINKLAWNKILEWQKPLWQSLLADTDSSDCFLLLFLKFMKCNLENFRDNLPKCVNLFGMSFLPPIYVQFFKKLSEVVDVNLYYLNPCQEFWEDCVSEKEKLFFEIKNPKSMQYWEVGNALLSSMGVLGRDFSKIINSTNGDELSDFQEFEEESLLQIIQNDMLVLNDSKSLDNDFLDQENTRIIDENDASIRIHICHSQMREIEILYDQILYMLESDKSLQPRDIIVMSPDIKSYSAYIKAVFSNPESESLSLPYSIADRSILENNPSAEAFLNILSLSQSRYTAENILDIFEINSVYTNFNFKEEDLKTLRRWIREVPICWGVDGVFREELGFPKFEQNSWSFAEERLMTGYAISESEGIQNGVMPYDVEGDDALLLGGFLNFMDLVFNTSKELKTNSKKWDISSWEAYLNIILKLFFKESSENSDELRGLNLAVQGILETIKLSGIKELDLEVIIYVLQKTLENDTRAGGFLHGGITFCRFRPMRSIPAKVICLIGMNDGSFPNINKKCDFDLMSLNPLPCDSNSRLDDRYLFLETLISVRKKLYISYIGKSIKDNSELPPSIIVAELLDYINDSFASAKDKNVNDILIVEHPLQAFSEKYFNKSSSLISYSNANYQAALIAREKTASSEKEKEKVESIKENNTSLTSETNEKKEVTIADFLKFFNHSTKYYLKDILKINFDLNEVELIENDEPMLFNTNDYSLNKDIIDFVLNFEGSDVFDKLYENLNSKGLIPYGEIGVKGFKSFFEGIGSFTDSVKIKLAGAITKPISININLNGKYNLTGEILNYYPEKGYILYGFSKNKAKYLLQAWIEGLLLKLKGIELEAILVIIRGKTKTIKKIKTETVEEIELTLPNENECLEYINKILNIYSRGIKRAIPFFSKPSWAFANSIFSKKDYKKALSDAKQEWLPSFNQPYKSLSEDKYNQQFYASNFFDVESPELIEFVELAQIIYKPIITFINKE